MKGDCKLKDLYSIGEVAKIMGVSIQTLRYYNSIDLLQPEYTNPATGYRYYSVNQLHFIDRIKYLQKLGLSLDEIKSVIGNNDIKKLVKGLMIESYIEDGAQKIGENIYGKSITDPCLGWEKTERLIYDIAESL